MIDANGDCWAETFGISYRAFNKFNSFLASDPKAVLLREQVRRSGEARRLAAWLEDDPDEMT